MEDYRDALLAEMERVFRRQLVGMLVGGAVALAAVLVVGRAGLLPSDTVAAMLVGGVLGIVGPAAGGLIGQHL